MIKIGIIGTGSIAEWHTKEFQKNPNSIIVSACDVSEERLNFFAINLISRKDIVMLTNCLINQMLML